MSTAIAVFFSQSEIYNIHEISLLSQAHQKIIWFDVPVDKIATMNVIRSTYLLELEYRETLCGLAHCCQRFDYM